MDLETRVECLNNHLNYYTRTPVTLAASKITSLFGQIEKNINPLTLLRHQIKRK